MTVRIQLSLLDDPADPLGPDRDFFVPNQEIIDPPEKEESNAIKKRNKRRSWYISECLKKD